MSHGHAFEKAGRAFVQGSTHEKPGYLQRSVLIDISTHTDIVQCHTQVQTTEVHFLNVLKVDVPFGFHQGL